MKKQKYLALLMDMPTDWIISSMRDPSPYMTQTHIKLHAIALRRRRMMV
jgi:hypothetical protein